MAVMLMGVLLWPQPVFKGEINYFQPFLVRVLVVMSMIQGAVTHHTS